MDTNATKTPVTLPFAAWQSLSPAEASRTLHERLSSLPENFRRAAVAWLKPESALAEELSRARALATPLAGVPYALKDLFDLAGVPTQAGSTFLADARGLASGDSALVTHLQRIGAACAGKTHLVEFAAGLFGDNAHYGDCPHPTHANRLSGGSSSGSASLVGAGVVPLAIGTDTGGSVRVPAAFCGVYGFRLTPHDAFIRDAMPLSQTLDTAGWFTSHATDLLAVNSALLGPSKSPATVELRGAYLPARAFDIAFDPETAAAYDRAASALATPLKADVSGAFFASWKNNLEAYTVTALSEAHAIHQAWLAPYRDYYEPSIWQRFTNGGLYSPAQLADARATLEAVRAVFASYFADYDYLILPATPFPALRKSECTPAARQALLTLTAPASLAGRPVLTIPVGLPSGLTTGLQVIVRDPTNLAVAALLKAQ